MRPEVLHRHNQLILERLRGVPLQRGTLADRFHTNNPNVKHANDNESLKSENAEPAHQA